MLVSAAAVIAALGAALGLNLGSGDALAGSAPSTGGSLATDRSPIPGSAIANAIAVPAAALDQVGAPTARAQGRIAAISAPEQTGANGKPRIVFVGWEFCPYCAAQRWPMVVALSRFGAFSGLGEVRSSRAEFDPDTASFSFHWAVFTSKFIDLTAVETADASGRPLDRLSTSDLSLVNQYDHGYGPNNEYPVPFTMIGNRYAITGPMVDAALLKGLSHDQIAVQLSNPNSPIAKAIDGSANVITAAICTLTGNQPAPVCQSAGVRAGAAQLPR